jgi:hypothetical protein
MAAIISASAWSPVHIQRKEFFSSETIRAQCIDSLENDNAKPQTDSAI